MPGRVLRREKDAGGRAASTSPERVALCRARALEVAAELGESPTRLARVLALRGLMTSGEFIVGKSSAWVAEALGMNPRTLDGDAGVAWLMVQDMTGSADLGSYAVSTMASALDRDSGVAEQLTERLEADAGHLEPKPLRDLAESWKAVAGERNRMAELLARASGRISSGGVNVNVDARSVNLAVYPPAERALLERAQGGDEDAGRMARLLLASGATTLGELREWLLPAATELYAETTEGESHGDG